MDKVLITGAGGFIGSHLVQLCVASGFSVKAFVHYNSKNEWGWLDTLEEKTNLEIVSGDIRDYDSVYSALEGCVGVFHLAALIGIPYSYVSPKAYIDTNIIGTYNVLQGSKCLGLDKIIITSTSETYGTAQYVPINESHPLVGQSPYSATKIGADQLAISYYRSFNLPVTIVRPFNVFGPRQSARAVIPTIVSQLLSGRRSIKLGSLNPTRDLTFVKDTAAGFVEAFRSQTLKGETVNIGMGFEISIGDLAKKIGKLMQVEFEFESDSVRIRPEHSEVERLWCDNTKLLKNTNWSPKYNLEIGLKETISFIEKNLNIYKPEIYNV